jgi:hypothetical protein
LKSLRNLAAISQNGLVLTALFIACAAHADDIRSFASDGCSAFPDGTLAQQELWLNCCTAHDYAYWKGGTYDERLAADEALRVCVADVGEAAVGRLMLAGVRVGGTPYLPTRFRWGFGWPWPRGYKALTVYELKQIEALGQ